MSKSYLVDTNIILRLLIGDVPDQKKVAQDFFRKLDLGQIKVVVSLLVINELVWICEKFYQLSRSQYLPILRRLLSQRGLVILEVKKNVLLDTLENLESSNLDFTDLYLSEAGVNNDFEIKTFDKKLAKLHKDKSRL